MHHRVLGNLVAGMSLLVLVGCGSRVVSDPVDPNGPSPTATSTAQPDPDPTATPAQGSDVEQPGRTDPPPCFNDGPFTLASGNTGGLANTVRARAAELEITIPGSGIPLRRSTNGSGGSNQWTNLGLDHLTTLTEVCRILGYQEYVSSGCLDGESSSRYPNGKCNYHSPSDNFHVAFDGTDWQVINLSSGDKYTTTWISSITCDATICDSGE